MKKITKTNFTDYFDKVYVLNMVSNTERKEFIINEFKELGIYDELINTRKLEWIEAIRLPFSQKSVDCMAKSEDVDFFYGNTNQQYVGQMMCSIEHYRIIKKSLLKGYKRICIFEDDVCIYKQFDYILKSLEEAPDDFNVLHLEGFYWPIDEDDNEKHYKQLSENINEAKWISCDNFHVWCTAALIYSEEGMKQYCKVQEECFKAPDFPTFWMENSYIYNYPLITQELPSILNSDIGFKIGNPDKVNVYLKYYNYNNYYHKN